MKRNFGKLKNTGRKAFSVIMTFLLIFNLGAAPFTSQDLIADLQGPCLDDDGKEVECPKEGGDDDDDEEEKKKPPVVFTPTSTPTFTPTATYTSTPTSTPTNTPTSTPTFTPSPTPTDVTSGDGVGINTGFSDGGWVIRDGEAYCEFSDIEECFLRYGTPEVEYTDTQLETITSGIYLTLILTLLYNWASMGKAQDGDTIWAEFYSDVAAVFAYMAAQFISLYENNVPFSWLMDFYAQSMNEIVAWVNEATAEIEAYMEWKRQVEENRDTPTYFSNMPQWLIDVTFTGLCLGGELMGYGSCFSDFLADRLG